MIYIFDNKQKIIKVLTNEDLTAGHLDFKINTATTFEFSVPANKSLSSSAKFVAVPHPLDDSKFVMLRLTERTDNADTIDYSAYELAYQELATYGYIEDKRPKNQSALNLMKIALDGSNWELNSVNVSGTATTNFYYVDRLSAISSVVDLLGGEIVFYIEIQGNAISGRYMDYLARQGEDTSKVFAKGSNLLTIERQSDTSGIYTAILPRGKGVETDGDNDASTPDGYGRRLNIADAVWKKSSGKPLDKPAGEIILYDPTANAEWGQIDGNYRLLLETYDEIDDVNTLINSAYKTLQSVNHPKIQYSATVADVGGLSLGDTVLIMHSERDLSYKTRVFEVNYDLLDPAQTEISLGDDLSSNDITSQINSVSSSQSIASEQTQWTINQVGRNPVTFGTVAPENPKVGDTFFKYLPNGDTVVYEWNGEIWVEKVSSNTSEQIDSAVDSAIETAKSQAAEMDAARASEAAVFQSEANAALSSAAAERAAFSSNAASMATSAVTHADSMANSAAAYAKAQAASALSSANSALSEAKSDLTNSINQEISDRNEAVQTVNSQAQDYADQAKADAIEAASTADGQVRKDFKETTDALSSTISQNKSDADGKISTAQATATQALDGLKTKVSQTDYNTKTGQLQTDLTATSQTANQAKTDIASIKSEADSQSAQINDIVSDARGTKQTISDLTTEQDKQSGSIATLQSRADGFDASITKINDFVNSQGQVNQLMNTEFTPDLEGWSASNSDITYAGISKTATVSGSNVFYITHSANTNWAAYRQQIIDFVVGGTLSASVYARQTAGNWVFTIDSYDSNGTRTIVKLVNITTSNTLLKIENVTIPSDASKLYFSFWGQTAGTIVIYKPMLVFDSTVGNYVQGNYNNNESLAKVKLTADKATLDLSNYKKDADGRISQAQSDITATANAVSTKVSQSDFDTITGDLTTKYGQVKVTADAVTTEVSNYKVANDRKVSANATSIETLNNQISSKVSQTDFDKTTGDLSGKYSVQQQTIEGISQTVTELQAKANAQGQINQLFNTEFSPDLQGWEDGSDTTSSKPYLTSVDPNAHGRLIGFNTSKETSTYYARFLQWVSVGSDAPKISLSWLSYAPKNTSSNANIYLGFTDDNNKLISSMQHSWITPDASWRTQKWENISLPAGTKKIKVSFEAREGIATAYLAHPMLVFDSTIGDYAPGNYNNNARVAALELDVSGIHGTVNDPNKGLSATWSLASNGQAVAIQAQKDAKTAGEDATTALTTAQGVQTTVNHVQDDVDALAQQTITADQFTVEVKDRKDGDDNTLSLSKKYTVSQIKDASDGFQSEIDQSAKGIIASLSIPNQLINTEFTPDLQGWLASNNFIASASLDKSATMHGSNVLNIVHSSDTGYGRYSQKISSFVAGGTLSASVYAKSTAGNWSFVIDSYNSSGTRTIVKSVNVPTSNTLLKFENITIPSDTSELYFSFWGQTAGTLAVSQPMLVFSDTLSTYMVGSASNSSTVLSLFRDNWDIGLADNLGKITSGIIGNNNSMELINNNIILSGKTTVTDDFYAKGGNFQNLNTSNLKTGTLNAENVNVININASNLAGGTIRGINIEAADINLVNDNSQIHGNYDWGDSDEAIFPRHYVGNWTLGKRRLQYYGDVTPNDSTNDGGKYSAYTYYGLDSIKMRRLFATGNLNRTVDIDAGKGELYIRKRDNEQQDMNANITVVEAGKAQFRGDNSRLVVSTNKVLDATNIVNTVQLKAGNDDETSSVQGYHIRGKRFSPPTGYDDNVWMYFYPSGDDTYYGLGLLRGDTVAQGYLSSTWAYSNTYSYSSNMYVTSNGNIGRATSASKYKLAITHYDELDRANKLLNIDPARWFDKAETEEYADELSGIKDSVEKLPVKPHFGLIAEDLVDAGLEEFVSYDTNTGEVEGLEYDRVWTVLIPLIRDMKKRIEELESEK